MNFNVTVNFFDGSSEEYNFICQSLTELDSVIQQELTLRGYGADVTSFVVSWNK